VAALTAGICSRAEPDTFPDRRDLRDACRSITEGPKRDARDLFRLSIRTCAFGKASRACGRLAETLRGVRRSHDAAQALRLFRPMPGGPSSPAGQGAGGADRRVGALRRAAKVYA
jgi:hypothetical protein